MQGNGQSNMQCSFAIGNKKHLERVITSTPKFYELILSVIEIQSKFF